MPSLGRFAKGLPGRLFDKTSYYKLDDISAVLKQSPVLPTNTHAETAAMAYMASRGIFGINNL